jgi:hypothetical protein
MRVIDCPVFHHRRVLAPRGLDASAHAYVGGRGSKQNCSSAVRVSRLFRWWFAFGFPAFAAVLGIFWLMIARPDIPLLTL